MADLNNLSSASHLELLDVVDQLRAHGPNDLLPLPQLIVCGDQSSGKSSVLEAISGVPFPRKDSLCTRFVTELRLRHSDTQEQIDVSIYPARGRSEAEKDKLLAFGRRLDDILQLPSVIEEAKIAVDLGSSENAFSEGRLHLILTGPKMPHLTIVDLFVLIHSDNKQQSHSRRESEDSEARAYGKRVRRDSYISAGCVARRGEAFVITGQV